jgi:hypothetical protein
MVLTPRNKEQREHYLNEECTRETFLFLANLGSFNLHSRRLVANAIRNAVYTPLLKREGEMAKFGPLDRQRRLNVTTLEILAKVYMALEDLGKILIAAPRPLREFPETFVTLEQKKSLGAFRLLANKSEKDLYPIVPFWRSEQYGLTGERARALDAYNFHTTAHIRKFLAFIADFTDKHDAAYNRYKHGMPVIVSLEGDPVAEGIESLVVIMRDGKNLRTAGMFLTGLVVVEKLIALLNTVVDLSKLLIDRRVQMVEFGGIPLPVLCERQNLEDGSVNYMASSFAGFDSALQAHLRAAFDDNQSTLGPPTNITANVNVRADMATLDEWIKFYQQDWRIE